MSKYAVIQNGIVMEVVDPFLDEDGAAIPIGERFSPEFVASLVAVPEGQGVTVGDTYVGTSFGPPLPPPTLSANAIIAVKVATVQVFMDGKAQALHYDDIKSACTYADEPSVPKFQAEGQAFRAWRSLAWAKCYEILDAVSAGTQPVPTDDELIAALPSLVLPGV